MKRNEHISTDREESTECGIGKFRPQFLQHFANINVFVAVYCATNLVSQTLVVYVNTQVSNLERQFGLNSAQSGLIMAFNDIGYFSVVLFISAAARFVHIPRALCFCIFLYGISGLTCALPQLIAVSQGMLTTLNVSSNFINASEDSNKRIHLCRTQNRFIDKVCQSAVEEKSSVLAAPSYSIQTLALSLIGIGMALQGIGKAPRVPFYMVYIDDNIDRRKTGFYTGIVVSSAMFGPAIAFAVGGYFSKIYVTLEEIDMDPLDPRWIGAWWLGFVVFGAVSVLLSLFLPFFPRRLKMSPKDIAKGKVQERPSTQKQSLSEKMKLSMVSYFRIIRNPIFILTSANQVFTILSVGGWSGFVAKFMMIHFNIPLHMANYILAGAHMSTVSVGTFLGGLLTRKISMIPRNVYKMILCFYSLNTIFLAVAMLMSCPQPTIIGPGTSIPGYVDISSQNCSLDCSCENDDFFPVCGSNRVNYHSPCFAGCTELLRNGRVFTNCSCIPDGRAEAGLCDDRCAYLIPWSISIFLSSIAGSMKIAPNFIAIIRSVDDRDKAAALGLNSFATSSIGWTLSPILFGNVLDASCQIWQFPCSSSGACELYDFHRLRLSFHGISIAMKFMALGCIVLLIMLTRKWQNWKFSNNYNLSKTNEDVHDTGEEMKLTREQRDSVE